MTLLQSNKSAPYFVTSRADPSIGLEEPEGFENFSPYFRMGPSYVPGLSSLSRHSLYVDSLTIQNSPTSGILVNLDTTQLYTAGGAGAGLKYTAPSPTPLYCWSKYGTSDGAYASPVPVMGAPIEYRKVYFRGKAVDSYGKIIGCGDDSVSSSGNSYFAYFACSNPVQQTCEDDAGCEYNSRNENMGISEGFVSDWEFFDIGGGGGDSCPDAYRTILARDIYDGDGYNTSGLASGCNSILAFAGESGLSPSVSQAGDTTTVKYSVDISGILDSIGTCYSTVIAVTSGSLYTGQYPYEAQTGYCTIRTVNYAASIDLVDQNYSECCADAIDDCTEAVCVTDIAAPYGHLANGTYQALDYYRNGRVRFVRTLHQIHVGDIFLQYNGTNWEIYNYDLGVLVASAAPGTEACPDEAVWSGATVVVNPAFPSGMCNEPTTTTTTAAPTTTTTTTTTTAAPTTTTTPAPCSYTSMCVSAAPSGNGTYARAAALFNGKAQYSQIGYTIRYDLTRWQLWDTGGSIIISESDATNADCPSDATWPITVAPC